MTEENKEASKDESLSDVGGKEITLELKGKEYIVSVPTLGDMRDFENMIRSRRLKEFREASMGMDDSARIEGMTSIVRSTVTLFDVELELSSMHGVGFILHRSLIENHPEITLEEIETMVDLANFQEIATIVRNLGGRANRPPPPEPEEEDSQED